MRKDVSTRNLELYADYKNGMKHKELAEKYGISVGRVGELISQMKWREEKCHGFDCQAIPTLYEDLPVDVINELMRHNIRTEDELYEAVENRKIFKRFGKARLNALNSVISRKLYFASKEESFEACEYLPRREKGVLLTFEAPKPKEPKNLRGQFSGTLNGKSVCGELIGEYISTR